MANEEILQRLDRIIAILQLANHADIEEGRERIRADDLNGAVLDAATKEIAAGKLVEAAQRAAKGSPSKPTVKRRIAALVDQGALERIGAGPATRYKVTGLV